MDYKIYKIQRRTGSDFETLYPKSHVNAIVTTDSSCSLMTTS